MNKEPTIEQMIEEHDGWKPGSKQKFDQAMSVKNKALVKKLLPDVPKNYQTRFKSNIDNIINPAKSKALSKLK